MPSFGPSLYPRFKSVNLKVLQSQFLDDMNQNSIWLYLGYFQNVYLSTRLRDGFFSILPLETNYGQNQSELENIGKNVFF